MHGENLRENAEPSNGNGNEARLPDGEAGNVVVSGSEIVTYDEDDNDTGFDNETETVAGL